MIEADTPAQPVQPLSLKALLDESLRQLRARLRALYLPFALPLAIASGAMPIVQLRVGPVAWGRAGTPPLEGLVAFGLVMLFFIVIYVFSYTAMIVAATDAVLGRPVSIAGSWLRAFDPRLVGTQILVWVAIGIGLVFCLVPGIYLALILGLVVPVVAAEKQFGLRALKRSAALMSHNPRKELTADPRLRVFLLYVASTLIGYALNLVIQLPFMVVMWAFMFRSFSSGRHADPEAFMQSMVWLQVPSNMLSMLTQTVIFLYVAFGLALLYRDQVLRKEGGDLEAAAERLAQTPEGL